MSSSVDVIAILKKAKQKRKGFVNGAKTSVQQQKLLHEVRQLSPDAVQNYAIKIPGKSYLRHADVAIPYLRLDFEYDGKYYHAGKDKKQDDNYRDFELKALGWRTIRVNAKNYKSFLTLLPEFIKLRKQELGIKFA